MSVYQDSELFPNDTLKTYYFGAFCSPAYRSIFAISARWVEPQSTAELLGIVLALASAWLAYQIGVALLPTEPVAGIAGLGWYLVAGMAAFDLHFIRWIQGGLQRAFLVPCIFLGILGLLTRRPAFVVAALVIGALFYPPAAVMLGVVWLVFLLFQAIGERRLSRDWLWLIGGAAASLAILLANRPAGWSNYSLHEALGMTDFFDRALAVDGVLYHSLWPYLENLAPFPGWLTAVLAGLVVWMALRRPDFPWSLLLSLVLGSWISYGLAFALFNRLYEPARYLFPMRCTWLLIAPIIAADASTFIRNVIPWRLDRRFAFLMLVVCLVLATWEAAVLCKGRIERGEGGVRGALPDAAYDYLATLPKGALIAGHPLDIGDVPLRSRRRALLLAEALYPCHKEFYEEAKRRFVDVLHALYAPDFGPALELRTRYGADFLVVRDQNSLSTDPYSQTKTFDGLYQQLDKNLSGHPPAVAHPPAEAVAFAHGGCKIIDLAKLQSIIASHR